MGFQLLFCVEADRSSGTDWVYIKSVIDKYYRIDNTISIKPIFMGGKTNYRRGRVVNEIKTASREFRKNGNTAVIFCIDTDDCKTDPDRKREFEEIKQYCNEKDYDLIWFCRDIEEVFWGKRITSSDKKDHAKRFRANSIIDSFSISCIVQESPSIGKSNILVVLNKYLSTYRNTELAN